MNIEFLLYALCLFLLATLFVIRKINAKEHLMAQQIKGIRLLKLLRDYLAKVQKHRGLTTAYIMGNTDMLPEIDTLNQSMMQDIDLIFSVGEWINHNERWLLIEKHWSKLQTSFKNNKDADNNLEQHNRLIKNTLYLIEEMADEHSLLLLKGDLSLCIELLWKDLLKAIDYMGQARALGTGVATNGVCSSVERIRMSYLRKKIEENSLVIVNHLPQGEIAKKEVKTLLNCIDEHILGSYCNLDAKQYFDMATATIENLYKQYDQALHQLKINNFQHLKI
jgi:hypothetical protein